MNKEAYQTIRRLVRDNGLRYVTHYASSVGDMATLSLCESMANLMRLTDELALRQFFAQTEKPSIAIKLTSDVWLARRDMDKGVVLGNYPWNCNRGNRF